MNTDGMTQAEVEAQGVAWAREILRRWVSADGDIWDTHAAVQSQWWQRLLGDYLLKMRDGRLCGVEVKTERRHTGNLFVETWSNRTTDPEWRREGWAFTLRAVGIVFVFLDAEVAYAMDFRRLCEWGIYDGGNIYRYPEKPAGLSAKGGQRNMTIGHCVPIAAVRAGISVRVYQRDAFTGQWRDATNAQAEAEPLR